MRRAVLSTISGLVLAVWFAVAVGTVWLGFRVWPNVVSLVLVGVLAVFVVFTRPRLPQRDRSHVRVLRGEAPTLFGVIDEIAGKLGASAPTELAISADYNAWTTRVGVRRRLLIGIGLPLWDTMHDDERLAVLAHEVAHDVNGDLRRGAVTGGAIDVVAGWDDVLWPPPWEMVNHDVSHMLGWCIQYVVWQVPRGILWALGRLTFSSMRTGELRADVLSVECAGKAAADRALRKTLYLRPVLFSIGKALETGAERPLSAGRRHIDELADERRRSYAESASASETRVDGTHPPTAQRLEAIDALPWSTPRIAFGRDRSAAIDRELAAARGLIAEELRGRLPLV